MEKLEIFDEVVEIMRTDSSTCKDIKGGEVEKYRSQISEDMSEKEFVFVMKAYLGSFGIPAHVGFGRAEEEDVLEFQVRRYQNELYVTAVAENASLKIGDRIVAVDGMSVQEIADKYSEFFYGEVESRQGSFWGVFLKFFSEITVIRKESGIKESLPICLRGEWKDEAHYEFKKLADHISYLRLDDFANEEVIQKVYDDNAEEIGSNKYLIIDVRNNAGGSDTAYFTLLKYCLPEGKNLEELTEGVPGEEVLYTERNVKLRLELIEEYRKMELPEETLVLLKQMEEDLIANRGKGFLVQRDDFEVPMVGEAVPEKVFILADCNCCSSGDSFVENMSRSSKVTVVGRPTMGICDYSNINEIHYDSYWFVYPTSRLLAIDSGNGMTRKGIPVDIFIPWTPEHLERDVDLEKALELIAANE